MYKKQSLLQTITVLFRDTCTKLINDAETSALQDQKKPKSFPSHKGPLGGADLRYNSPQPKLQVHGHGASVSHGVPV